jgi:predicted lysophospholipase L1 biosynthesis ABC-type transport system permease subunit
VLGVPVVQGREISQADTQTSPPVVVVNETFVKRLLPNASPLGHRLGGKNPFTIIGVVRDSKYTGVGESPHEMAYYPQTQTDGVSHVEVVVRTNGNPTALLPSIRAAVQALDRDVPLEDPMTQQAVFEHSYAQEHLLARLSSFFGLLAAFLIAIGLYWTLVYRVRRRTAEIGVRMALGATRSNVFWALLRESLKVGGLGLALGLPGAWLLVGFMRSLLYRLEARDPLTFWASLALVVLIALAAGFLPARQAASIEPMAALRAE